MARIPKSDAAQCGCVIVYEPSLECRSNDFSLGLKPAELEALLERLCWCSTLRVSGSGPARYAARCTLRVRKQWCRVGERGANGQRIETRFG